MGFPVDERFDDIKLPNPCSEYPCIPPAECPPAPVIGTVYSRSLPYIEAYQKMRDSVAAEMSILPLLFPERVQIYNFPLEHVMRETPNSFRMLQIDEKLIFGKVFIAIETRIAVEGWTHKMPSQHIDPLPPNDPPNFFATPSDVVNYLLETKCKPWVEWLAELQRYHDAMNTTLGTQPPDAMAISKEFVAGALRFWAILTFHNKERRLANVPLMQPVDLKTTLDGSLFIEIQTEKRDCFEEHLAKSRTYYMARALCIWGTEALMKQAFHDAARAHNAAAGTMA